MADSFEIISSITGFAPRASTDGSAALVDAARRAEADGVDMLLVGYVSSRPDGWMTASYALANTTSIRVLLAHRPGIMSPALAARMTSTLDVLSGGRISLNVVTGGSALDQMREGDFVSHDERYRRSIEYVDVMRRLWTATEPLDFEGRFYRLTQSFQSVKPLQKPNPPIYMGGASDAAKEFAVAQADVYMSWSEPVDAVKARFDELRRLCREAGRSEPRFSVSMRLIMDENEDEAWRKAERMLPPDVEEKRQRELHREDVGRNRQLMLVRDSLVHDERLWMGLAAATGGQGSSGALVGTPDQVLRSLLRYVEHSGTDALLLTGANGSYEKFPPGFLAELRSRANSLLAARARNGSTR